ncbi:MAG: DUF1772 domain-containing protein [Thermomicrobiales bacterium]|nr:DUF1772 domain-containing protein [Thermomicrobiales bacterium]
MIVLLVALVITSGLLAGFFFAWWCSCMVGLRNVRDVTFVETMLRINAVLPNRRFIVPFFAPVLLAPIVAWMLLGSDQRPAGIWAGVAAIFSAFTFVITAGRNVPLNESLAKASINEASATRRAFEVPWVRWNSLRTLTSVVAFVASVLALASRS